MSIEAMKQRLEELEKIHSDPMLWRSRRSKINFLRQAIEEAEKQEPYGYFRYDIRLDAWVQSRDSNKGVAFYTHPPKREWVGLTDEEAAECWNSSAVTTWKNIEAKLREKNKC